MGENDIEGGWHTHIYFGICTATQSRVKKVTGPGLMQFSRKIYGEKKKALYNLTCVIKGFVILQAARWAFLRMCINLAYHCTKSINNIKLMASDNGDIFSTNCLTTRNLMLGVKSTCLSYQWERRKLNISDVVCDPFPSLLFWAFELHLMNTDTQLGIHMYFRFRCFTQMNEILMIFFSIFQMQRTLRFLHALCSESPSRWFTGRSSWKSKP